MKDAKYTLDLVNTDGVNEKGMELLRKLSTTTKLGQKDPKDSIMQFESLCDHDDGWLCECRLQVIADWIKENQRTGFVLATPEELEAHDKRFIHQYHVGDFDVQKAQEYIFGKPEKPTE